MGYLSPQKKKKKHLYNSKTRCFGTPALRRSFCWTTNRFLTLQPFCIARLPHYTLMYILQPCLVLLYPYHVFAATVILSISTGKPGLSSACDILVMTLKIINDKVICPWYQCMSVPCILPLPLPSPPFPSSLLLNDWWKSRSIAASLTPSPSLTIYFPYSSPSP